MLTLLNLEKQRAGKRNLPESYVLFTLDPVGLKAPASRVNSGLYPGNQSAAVETGYISSSLLARAQNAFTDSDHPFLESFFGWSSHRGWSSHHGGHRGLYGRKFAETVGKSAQKIVKLMI
jgi:hypothetical protein